MNIIRIIIFCCSVPVIGADVSDKGDILVTVYNYLDALIYVRLGYNVDVSRLWRHDEPQYARLKQKMQTGYSDEQAAAEIIEVLKRPEAILLLAPRSQLVSIFETAVKYGKSKTVSLMRNCDFGRMFESTMDQSTNSFVVEYIRAIPDDKLIGLGFPSFDVQVGALKFGDVKSVHCEKIDGVFVPVMEKTGRKRLVGAWRGKDHQILFNYSFNAKFCGGVGNDASPLSPWFPSFKAPSDNNAHFERQPIVTLKRKEFDSPIELKTTKKFARELNHNVPQPVVEKPRNCIIDAKYLELDNIDLRFATKGQSSKLTGSKVYHLSLVVMNGINNLPIHQHELAGGSLTLLSASANINEIISSRRVTFVRNGRNERGLVPQEDDGGRIIFVMPRSQIDQTQSLVRNHHDVLLINPSANINDNDAGLAGVRWWASLHAAFQLKLKSFMIMDDNISSIHTKEIELSSWKNVYEIYQRTAHDYQAAIVSSPSFRPHKVDTQLSSAAIKANVDRFGYKLFYVDREQISSVIDDVANLVPPNVTWPLQDIFFQEVVAQAGLTIAKLSLQSLVLQRSRKARNACAKSYAKRNISALVWKDAQVDSYPEIYRRACGKMNDLIHRSTSFHESKLSVAQAIELSTLGMKKRLSPDSKNEPFAGYSEKSSRTIMRESLALIDHAPLRKPQKDAIKATHEFLAKSSLSRGFFEMPTGSGKTKIFTQMAKAFRAHAEAQEKPVQRPHVLIITPTKEISMQIKEGMYEDAIVVIDSDHISQRILQINNEFISHHAKPKIVVMCERSFQILADSNNGTDIVKQFGLLVVDEMHTISRENFKNLIRFNTANKSIMLGFSATPSDIKNLFEKRIFHYEIIDAIKDGFLVPWKMKFQQPGAFDSFEKIRSSVKSILSHLKGDHEEFGHRGLIWVSKIEFANKLVREITADCPWLKDSIAAYHTMIDARQSILNDFRTGKIKILVAVRTLKEGFDVRDLDFAIIARNVVPEDDFIQMLGRILRVSEALPNKVARIYLAPDAVRTQKRMQSFECPRELMPAKQLLAPEKWRVIPFPLHTSGEDAIRFSTLMIKTDRDTKIFDTIKQEIYGDLLSAANKREFFRHRENYKRDENHGLRRVYWWIFDSQRDYLMPEQKPTANIYVMEEVAGKPQYRLIASNKGDDALPPLNILKKSREYRDPQTNSDTPRNHYELLRKL